MFDREEILANISDLYKDVHGFRPLGVNYSALDDSKLESEYMQLLRAVEENSNRNRQLGNAAVDIFRKEVREAMALVGCDWTHGVAIVCDSYGVSLLEDPELVCFELTLPYSMAKYIREAAHAYINRVEALSQTI